MKNKFSIIAPHPDDEFIGLRKLISVYGYNVDNIIIVSNGELSVIGFPDYLQYIESRRLETKRWIKKYSPNCDFHFLNVQDGIDAQGLIESYGSTLFSHINNISKLSFLMEKVKKIVGDNILLLPNTENHPTHSLAFTLGELNKANKIYYSVHSTFEGLRESPPGCYWTKVELLKKEYFNYTYIYTDEEYEEKKREFEWFYPSQAEDFKKTNLTISNWENYMSSIPLRLCSEDNMIKVEKDTML